MKTFNALGLGAIVVLGAAGAWLGCDSTNAPLPPAADAGSPSDAHAASDAGAPLGDGAVAVVALTCPAYCADIMATCTGNYAQYNPTMVEECTNACGFLPVGDAGAASGDSLACRITHTGYAATIALNPHCWHAGPFGFGGCGDECEAFCLIATGYCSAAGGFDGGAPPYASQAACMTDCEGYARINGGDAGLGVDGGYNAAGPTTGDTLDCREWHLGVALQSPQLQQLHCNHVGVTSATCFAPPAGDQ